MNIRPDVILSYAFAFLPGALALSCTGNDSPAPSQPEAGLAGVIEFDASFDVGERPMGNGSNVPGLDGGATRDAANAAMPSLDAAPEGGAALGLPDAGADSELFILGDIRTNVSHLGFLNTGTDDLAIVSIHFRMVAAGSFHSLLIHGEIVNRGAALRCIPLADVAIGAQDILAIVAGDAHVGTLAGSTTCIPAGGRGVFRGIENDVSPTLVDDADSLTYAISALVTDYPPHPSTPVLLSVERVLHEGGYALAGRLRSKAMPIHNFQIDFYDKDDRGLIVDDTSAFPLDLDTIPTNSIIDYASYPFSRSAGPVAGFIYIMEFLDGAAPGSGSSVDPDGELLTPEAQRAREASIRRARYDALQAELP